MNPIDEIAGVRARKVINVEHTEMGLTVTTSLSLMIPSINPRETTIRRREAVRYPYLCMVIQAHISCGLAGKGGEAYTARSSILNNNPR